jgi:NTP pyrophosphatase (non-canonical NTP hydrolase)
MTLSEYQEAAKRTALYPPERGLEYTALGIASEAGEVAGKVKKIIRDDGGMVSDERRREVAGEVGDVLWYAAQVCSELGLSLDQVARDNIDKLASRQQRGALGGDGDNR